MDPNPYEPPKVADGGWSPGLTSKLTTLRLTVAFLIGVVVFQWICHFLTAAAMYAWMKRAEGGPTAQILDTMIYGMFCVGFTGVLSVLAGFAGMRVLRRTDGARKD